MSRFGISKPKLLNNSSSTGPSSSNSSNPPQLLPDFDFLRGASGLGDSPYPSLPPASSTPYESSSLNSVAGENRAGVGAGVAARYNGEPSSSRAPPHPSSLANSVATSHGGSESSPLRPARSQRRSQMDAAPPSLKLSTNLGGPSSAAAAPRPPPSALRQNSAGTSSPSNPAGLVVPGASGASFVRSPTAMTPVGLMPASPISPADSAPSSSAPWAAEREMRSQARQHSKESAKVVAQAESAQKGDVVTERLRNVVGAFKSASRNREAEQPARRPPRRKTTQASKPSWDELLDGGAGATGGKFAEIDAVMRKIHKEWPFVLEGDFSASSLAMSLLSDTPSSALPPHPDLESFMDVHQALSIALQKAVQSDFQTFAASLPTHAAFIAALDRAMAQIRTSREALKQAREGISTKGKAELAGVRNRERMVREMLQILDLIDELKQVPEQLEEHIAEKRFLQAALLLVKSIKTINREDVREVGAVADLRQYFLSQETALTDILVEELHSHIYLKTINSETRWRTYTPGQHTLPVIENEELFKDSPLTDNESSRFSQYLSNLAIKPNQEPILDDLRVRRPARNSAASRNTTSITSITSLTGGSDMTDAFSHMESLLEALAALGRLGQALDTLVQRVPSEIHTLIETTMEEVNDRADQRTEELAALAAVRPQQVLLIEKHDLESMPLFDNDTLRVVLSLDNGGPPKHAIILRDLFWTLFSKLAAVMEGHRAVYEVSRWIASRRDFKDMKKVDLNLNVPVLEIWRPVEHEVRTLLQGYVRDESTGLSLPQNALPSINQVLREGRLNRDKQRVLFKFGDSDQRAVNTEIKEFDESLKQTLRASVPGLINLQATESINVVSGSSASDDQYATSGKYRTLIPANPFNVTILFEPTIALMDRCTSIVPPGFEDETSQFGSGLEEFVKSVFLPQLDEKVTASFRHAVSGPDALQLDHRPIIGLEKPPIRSSVRVMALIQSLCIMLQETPFHRENYSRLVVGVVVQYYQQLHSRFKELAALQSGVESSMALPAVWAQREDVAAVLAEVYKVAPDDHQGAERTSRREIKLELGLLSGSPPRDTQLLNSSRRFESLGNLANSMRWFMNALLDLQQLADEDELGNPKARVCEPGDPPRLPLTPAMSESFEALVHTYEQLVEMTLNTLHLEVRCRVLCNLSASLKRPDHRLESEPFEPDPDVVDLNASLIDMDDMASQTLSRTDKQYLFRGLATLIDHLFVSAARNIKAINVAGAHKIQRNILSLQQTLRGIMESDREGTLLRATEFWGLFELGPKTMLANISSSTKPMFSFEDYNAMLELQCKPDGEEETQDLNAYLIDLHAVAMELDEWGADA